MPFRLAVSVRRHRRASSWSPPAPPRILWILYAAGQIPRGTL